MKKAQKAEINLKFLERKRQIICQICKVMEVKIEKYMDERNVKWNNYY